MTGPLRHRKLCITHVCTWHRLYCLKTPVESILKNRLFSAQVLSVPFTFRCFFMSTRQRACRDTQAPSQADLFNIPAHRATISTHTDQIIYHNNGTKWVFFVLFLQFLFHLYLAYCWPCCTTCPDVLFKHGEHTPVVLKYASAGGFEELIDISKWSQTLLQLCVLSAVCKNTVCLTDRHVRTGLKPSLPLSVLLSVRLAVSQLWSCLALVWVTHESALTDTTHTRILYTHSHFTQKHTWTYTYLYAA